MNRMKKIEVDYVYNFDIWLSNIKWNFYTRKELILLLKAFVKKKKKNHSEYFALILLKYQKIKDKITAALDRKESTARF